jgi:hypothetical protein
MPQDKTRPNATPKMLSTDNLLSIGKYFGVSLDQMLGRGTDEAKKMIEAEKPLDKLKDLLSAEDLAKIKQIGINIQGRVSAAPSQTSLDKNIVKKSSTSPTKSSVITR